MILTHRMSGIIIIYIIGFLITLMISKYAKSLKEKKVLLVIITLGVLLYIVFYLILNFGVVDERVYINSNDFISKTISIMYRHSIYIGAAIILLPLSILYLLKNGLNKGKDGAWAVCKQL